MVSTSSFLTSRLSVPLACATSPNLSDVPLTLDDGYMTRFYVLLTLFQSYQDSG